MAGDDTAGGAEGTGDPKDLGVGGQESADEVFERVGVWGRRGRGGAGRWAGPAGGEPPGELPEGIGEFGAPGSGDGGIGGDALEEAGVHGGHAGVAGGEDMDLDAIGGEVARKREHPLDGDAAGWGEEVANDEKAQRGARSGGRSSHRLTSIAADWGRVEENEGEGKRR